MGTRRNSAPGQGGGIWRGCPRQVLHQPPPQDRYHGIQNGVFPAAGSAFRFVQAQGHIARLRGLVGPVLAVGLTQSLMLSLRLTRLAD